MGAWSFLIERFDETVAELGRGGQRVGYAGRPAAAAPATGLMSKHLAQQAQLVDEALTVAAPARPARQVSSTPAKAKAPAAGKGTAKKAASKKAVARKSPARKAAAKPAARKASAKKSGGRKAAAKSTGKRR